MIAYNKQAVVTNYGKTDDSAEHLISEMPLISDISPVSCQLNNIDNAGDLAQIFDLRLDGIHNPVSQEAVELLISQINQSCEALKEQELKEDGIRIPIGKIGHETHYFTLGFDSGVYHALIGGGTGSDKTNLLHVMITRCAEQYSRDEVSRCCRVSYF